MNHHPGPLTALIQLSLLTHLVERIARAYPTDVFTVNLTIDAAGEADFSIDRVASKKAGEQGSGTG